MIKSPKPRYKKSKYINQAKIATDFEPALKRRDEINFSFKYLDLEDSLFDIEDCDSSWFKLLFERKKNYCSMHPNAVRLGGKATRCHPIKWEDTSKPQGLNVPNLGWDIHETQLTISKQHGRIIGFFAGNTFFVKWFDPEHNLYPQE